MKANVNSIAKWDQAVTQAIVSIMGSLKMNGTSLKTRDQVATAGINNKKAYVWTSGLFEINLTVETFWLLLLSEFLTGEAQEWQRNV